MLGLEEDVDLREWFPDAAGDAFGQLDPRVVGTP
jgi:hypothetical protein